MQWNDEENVREQYQTPSNLAVRTSVWLQAPHRITPQDVVVDLLKLAHVRSVLDVGAGRGQLTARMKRDLSCEVVALDASLAMVKTCVEQGVDAVVGDARDLPFPSHRFDAVVAAWMLYHVAPLEQALIELERVLVPGGALVAVTNGQEHLAELWNLAGVAPDELAFSRENGEVILSTRFDDVHRLDVDTYAYFADRTTAEAYLKSTNRMNRFDRLPHDGWPRTVAGVTSVFVATSRA